MATKDNRGSICKKDISASFVKLTNMSMKDFDKTNKLPRGYTQKVLNKGYCTLLERDHKKAKHPLYITWMNMVRRCIYPRATGYHLYGGKGIRVCWRWLNSFKNFLDDMGERPEKTQLDRIDPNGWYSPENCRWVSYGIQAANKTLTNKFAGMTIINGKYFAQIGYRNRNLNLGVFDNPVDAQKAYISKFKELWGFAPHIINGVANHVS